MIITFATSIYLVADVVCINTNEFQGQRELSVISRKMEYTVKFLFSFIQQSIFSGGVSGMFFVE